jgi:signal transduction histidine kinase
MSRILLLIDHRQNRHLLAEWLTQHYQVMVPESDDTLQDSFDLAIVDGPPLNRLWAQVQQRKQAEEPLFLPVLLLTSRQGVELATRHLWRAIDEVVLRPIEKVELQARVEILLRARRLSMALQQRQSDLETFSYAMTHELRAPFRVIAGFVEELQAATTLGDQEQHCLRRIFGAASQAQGLIAALHTFGRLGHEAVKLQTVSLHHVIESCLRHVIESCLRHVQSTRRMRQDQVILQGDQVMVHADPRLLKLALTNLVANALTFVAPGVPPLVTIKAGVTGSVCRIEVTDNGLGITPEDQSRLFSPFVRLHGVEEYPGIGLGLATVRKAVELMGGQVGVTSVPGAGSTFWIELSQVEGEDESLIDR